MNVNYELLDFGKGRKLERFGAWIVDRPSPAAESTLPTDASLWKKAHARYERESAQAGKWRFANDFSPDDWQLAIGSFRLRLQPTESGQVGVFMEQQANWDWLAARIRRAAVPLKILNLFAYSGASTLAAAAAGAEVVHVDAAGGVVQWARQNAEISGLAAARIRWITEDAMKFVEREIKRGQQYDAVILDPPSYGHGPKGEAFRLSEHLMPMLDGCRQLTEANRAFFLLTCHSPGFGPAELEACLSDAVFGAVPLALTPSSSTCKHRPAVSSTRVFVRAGHNVM